MVKCVAGVQHIDGHEGDHVPATLSAQGYIPLPQSTTTQPPNQPKVFNVMSSSHRGRGGGVHVGPGRTRLYKKLCSSVCRTAPVPTEILFRCKLVLSLTNNTSVTIVLLRLFLQVKCDFKPRVQNKQ